MEDAEGLLLLCGLLCRQTEQCVLRLDGADSVQVQDQELCSGAGALLASRSEAAADTMKRPFQAAWAQVSSAAPAVRPEVFLHQAFLHTA